MTEREKARALGDYAMQHLSSEARLIACNLMRGRRGNFDDAVHIIVVAATSRAAVETYHGH